MCYNTAEFYHYFQLRKIMTLVVIVIVIELDITESTGAGWRAFRVKINDKYGFDAREVTSPDAYGKLNSIIYLTQTR